MTHDLLDDLSTEDLEILAQIFGPANDAWKRNAEAADELVRVCKEKTEQ